MAVVLVLPGWVSLTATLAPQDTTALLARSQYTAHILLRHVLRVDPESIPLKAPLCASVVQIALR